MQYVSRCSTCGHFIMAAMSLQSGMISEPPVNVNDSDHFEPARLSMGGKVQEAEMKTNRKLYK